MSGSPLVHELSSTLTPVDAVECFAGCAHRLFLDSAAVGLRQGRYSFVMADPAALVRSRHGRTEIWQADAGDAAAGSVTDCVTEDALAVVRRLLSPHASVPVAGLPPFQGGAAGYVGYDWGLTLERLPAPRFDDLSLDDVVIGIYDWVLAWDHAASKAWLISTGLLETDSAARAERAETRAAEVLGRLQGTATVGAAGDGLPAKTGPMAPSYAVEGGWWPPALGLRSSYAHADYIRVLERVREYIFAGDIFQANVSQRFEVDCAEAPWSLYRRLRAHNPAPFAAFFELPDAAVVSASPERFLHVDPSGHVETRPIKGTRARGMGPEHDAALGQALTESAKDRAENLMIVDLMRNDLSRVCLPGSVRVSELFALERYATVHHLVSTVVGDLAPGHDALDALRTAFPGGSITGAPKLRAMEIIAECEPSRRGVYCGSMGYWSVTGAMDTNIAIRTAVVKDGRAYFSAGGGIVADSDPEQEYRETLDKARALIDVLAGAL
jgi:para-aminobenzoate synthetase component 1